MTVEHLGATMWTNDPVTGRYAPTGDPEWGTTYTMQRNILGLTNAEQDAYLAAVNATGWPNHPVATVRPGVRDTRPAADSAAVWHPFDAYPPRWLAGGR